MPLSATPLSATPPSASRHWQVPPGVTLNLALALIALLAAAFCLAALKAAPALQIRDTAGGKVYGVWPLKGEGGGDFAIEFIHSVHNSPVREIFKVEGSEIRPLAVRFASFGAGMQSDLEEGQVLSRDGDDLVLSGGSRRFRELHYIVGTVSDHILYINGQTISLRELCGRNAHITIGVNR